MGLITTGRGGRKLLRERDASMLVIAFGSPIDLVYSEKK